MNKTVIVLLFAAIMIIGLVFGNHDSPNEGVKTSDPVVIENTKSNNEKPESEETVKEESVKEETVLVDVKEIAGKSREEVEKVLGKPLKTEKFDFEMGPDFTSLPVTMGYYIEILEGDMGRVEIMYVDGGAQRIQVNLIGEEYCKDDEYNKNLAYAGLPIVELDPPVNEVQKVRYKENALGFHRITVGDWLGTQDGNVEIITKEKYE